MPKRKILLSSRIQYSHTHINDGPMREVRIRNDDGNEKIIEEQIQACIRRFARTDEQRDPEDSLGVWFQRLCSQFMAPWDEESCQNFQKENGEYIKALDQLRKKYPSVLKLGDGIMKYWNIMLECIHSCEHTNNQK